VATAEAPLLRSHREHELRRAVQPAALALDAVQQPRSCDGDERVCEQQQSVQRWRDATTAANRTTGRHTSAACVCLATRRDSVEKHARKRAWHQQQHLPRERR
jgi:hypothetical protein